MHVVKTYVLFRARCEVRFAGSSKANLPICEQFQKHGYRLEICIIDVLSITRNTLISGQFEIYNSDFVTGQKRFTGKVIKTAYNLLLHVTIFRKYGLPVSNLTLYISIYKYRIRFLFIKLIREK